MLRILSIKSEEIKKGYIIIAVFTLFSQFLALIRENIFSKVLGAGIDLDLYNASFKITDIIFIASATLISTFVLIPILSRKEKEDEDLKKKQNKLKEKEENKNTENTEIKKYINKVFTTFSLYIAVLVLIFLVFTPQIVSFIFEDYKGVELEKLIEITRISLFAPFFMSIANIFISINQIKNYFLPYALMSVLNNISIILATLFLYPKYGVKGMIYGVVIGGFLYLAIHFPTVIKEKLFPKFSSFLTWNEILKIFSISLPRTIGIFSFTLIMIYISSKLPKLGEGYLSFFNWAFILSSVPSGFLGMAYSIAAFPKLSKLFVQNKTEEFSKEIALIFKNIIFFGLPISLFFVLFSKEFVALIYWNNNFTEEKLYIVSTALSILSVSILFQSFSFVLTRAFFAIENTIIPLIMNIISLIFIFISISFVFGFPEYLINLFGIENIFSNSLTNNEKFFIASWLYSIVFFILSVGMFLMMKKKVKGFCVLKGISLFKKIIIDFITVVILYFLYKFFSENYLLENGQMNSLYTLIIFTIIALIVFSVISKIFKENEYLNLENAILRKLKIKK